MFIEERTIGKRKKYYLAHSFKDNGKVKKIRRYLGANLSKSQIENLKKRAEVLIKERLKEYKRIKDLLKHPLSEEELKRLKKLEIKVKHLDERQWQRFSEVFAYDTNAIEGSTVTLKEVEGIIEEGKWPKDAAKWEVAETYGVADAVKLIRKTKVHLSLDLIKDIHKIVFENSKTFAGKFRGKGINVVITDGRGNIAHRGADPSRIVWLLNELIGWYKQNKKRYPPLVLAAVVHNQFENIHPFQDGNGRAGRLLLNNILLKQGLPPVNIELKRRNEYYNALQEYQHNGDIGPTLELLLKEYNTHSAP
ncbi:MAG: Fic family protein [Candidatus Woesearchaeota archaeon]